MSDVKVMSSTVAVMFAVINYSIITWVVNNYNIGAEQWFLTEPNQTHKELNPSCFSKKAEPKPNRNKKIYSAHPYDNLVKSEK